MQIKDKATEINPLTIFFLSMCKKLKLNFTLKKKIHQVQLTVLYISDQTGKKRKYLNLKTFKY